LVLFVQKEALRRKMSDSAQKLFRAALELSVSERAALVDELVSNLDMPDPRIDELWAREAEDRLSAFQSGKIAAVSAEEVFSEFERS
jgi:putative addiction module component (TIGR02574 family)